MFFVSTLFTPGRWLKQPHFTTAYYFTTALSDIYVPCSTSSLGSVDFLIPFLHCTFQLEFWAIFPTFRVFFFPEDKQPLTSCSDGYSWSWKKNSPSKVILRTIHAADTWSPDESKTFYYYSKNAKTTHSSTLTITGARGRLWAPHC